ncbi:MAG: hypothetical protein K8F91_23645 [Candidatus Obscuribacterales bacterium]|nr:hypothetical protein [Candidatus Obscuribacterales bacterium]
MIIADEEQLVFHMPKRSVTYKALAFIFNTTTGVEVEASMSPHLSLPQKQSVLTLVVKASLWSQYGHR